MIAKCFAPERQSPIAATTGLKMATPLPRAPVKAKQILLVGLPQTAFMLSHIDILGCKCSPDLLVSVCSKAFASGRHVPAPLGNSICVYGFQDVVLLRWCADCSFRDLAWSQVCVAAPLRFAFQRWPLYVSRLERACKHSLCCFFSPRRAIVVVW